MQNTLMLSIVTMAGALATISPTALGQDSGSSDWTFNLGLDLTYQIGRDISFDRSRSFYLHNQDWTLNDWSDYDLAGGEYNGGYVNEGTLGDGTTEDWGVDLAGPSSYLDGDGNIVMGRTEITNIVREYTFSNVGSGSVTDSEDYFMPMLRFGFTAPHEPDDNFRWGLFLGAGYGRVDADSGPYRTFDVAGGDRVTFSTVEDTFAFASGADEFNGEFYYGEPGANGPTIFFNPISTSTVGEYTDYFSGTGTAIGRQSLEVDLVELRLGIRGDWHHRVNDRNTLSFGLEAGPSLTIAHGDYSFSERLNIDTHGIQRTLNYEEHDSKTDVLFGAFVGANAGWNTFLGDMPTTFSIGAGYNIRENFDLGGASLSGNNWELRGGITIRF